MKTKELTFEIIDLNDVKGGLDGTFDGGCGGSNGNCGRSGGCGGDNGNCTDDEEDGSDSH